jgi:hypothetical protein
MTTKRIRGSWRTIAIACSLLALAPAAGRAARPRSTPVPPALEIEILDPNADPLGNPAIELADDGSGQMTVEIPPIVIVHRYYYTGDRTFQGPRFSGGPAIVVINHPRDGERIYIPVQMLPGAPEVTYTHDSIEYDYGENAITICFGFLGKPKVVYRNGVPLPRKVGRSVKKVTVAAGSLIERTGIPEFSAQTLRGTKDVAIGAADGVNSVGRAVCTPVAQIVSLLPLARTFQRTPEQEAEFARNARLRRAAADEARNAASIATVR